MLTNFWEWCSPCALIWEIEWCSCCAREKKSAALNAAHSCSEAWEGGKSQKQLHFLHAWKSEHEWAELFFSQAQQERHSIIQKRVQGERRSQKFVSSRSTSADRVLFKNSFWFVFHRNFLKIRICLSVYLCFKHLLTAFRVNQFQYQQKRALKNDALLLECKQERILFVASEHILKACLSFLRLR